ncbi:uncharacterized protein EDB93DRAFT_1100791 [Suillus bovinus]|uniref:uncharacterized protein n=1 Tax=Suillus bovinus TaxID=48563 RepID=UPI001B863A1F|nr:uncharacterized protein EDB93DRAFT_1100791 [Suillus bovinus]KAG2157991.1 hypothetical protein EDB93DRAFT_1100791 [Suillus bovinus]
MSHCVHAAPATTSQSESSPLMLPQSQKTDSAIARVFKKATETGATTSTRTHKRKLEDVNNQHENKENVLVLRPLPNPVPAVKCTDWQSVLDIVKYGEEQQGLAAVVKKREVVVLKKFGKPGHAKNWEDWASYILSILHQLCPWVLAKFQIEKEQREQVKQEQCCSLRYGPNAYHFGNLNAAWCSITFSIARTDDFEKKNYMIHSQMMPAWELLTTPLCGHATRLKTIEPPSAEVSKALLYPPATLEAMSRRISLLY